MRWQPVVRVLVAAVGIGCAVFIYATIRPRGIGTTAPRPTMLDPSATAMTKGTTRKQVDGDGREVYSMTSARGRVLADGRRIFEDVRTSFSRGGVAYVITAAAAESSGVAGPTGEEPAMVVFQGKVKMEGDDGFSVETEKATYLGDEQRMTFPEATAFTKDQLSGKGASAELFMDRSVLWLYDESQLTVTPASGGNPALITAKRIGLGMAEDYLRAQEGARMTQDEQDVSADELLMYFVPGTRTTSRIELMGRSQVRRTGEGQRPDMRGDDINIDFSPESGQLSHAHLLGNAVLTLKEGVGTTRVSGSAIELYLGRDGQTLTKLESTAPSELQLPADGANPARTIQSAGLIADGTDPKGLERAVFNGGVQYREVRPASAGRAAATRVASSSSLVLNLGGSLNQVSDAVFRQKFTVKDGDTTATADEGQYDAVAETLKLRMSNSGVPRPRVVDPEIEVTAQAIDLDLKQDSIDARVRVESVRKPTAPTSKPSTGAGLFEGGKPVSGNADALKYSRTTGLAVYAGTVTLLQRGGAGQDSSVLQADEVTLEEKKQDMAANGRVRSTFFIERAPGDADPKAASRTQLNGNRMVYTEATRTLVYTGAATMESGDGQRLTAEQITLEMVSDRRALKRLEAVATAPGVVRATLPEGRQAVGARLTYDAETDRYVVRGAPALFVSRAPAKGPDVCEVGSGTELSFLRTEGWSNVTNEGGAVGTARGDRKCSEVIK